MNKLTFSVMSVFLSVLLSACNTAAPSKTVIPISETNNSYGVQNGFEYFITRKGYQLFDGDAPFRFIGLHATELHRIEDDVQSAGSTIGKSDHFKWPTALEQENWIISLVMSGHTATRIYALSIDDISLPIDVRHNMPAHILWDEKTKKVTLNEEAMLVYDRMIALADKHGLRLILPLIDNWSWWGGKAELAKMVGEQGADTNEAGPLFDVNSKTYAAYQAIIRQVLTRKNTFTGRQYRDEKAIMAWETGNELRGTNPAFLAKTSAFIKSLAPNQLVVDGDQQADNILPVGIASVENGEYLGLLEPNVDIQSNHFYGAYMTPDNLIKQADLAKKYNKPFFLGEYGLQDFEKIKAITDAIAAHPAVAGALLWGYRGHREAGGFYWHKEGDSGHLSYHLPGYAINDANNEIKVISLLRSTQASLAQNSRAYRMSQTWLLPAAPKLHPVDADKNINWMGSPMAQSYNLYRSHDGDNWALIGDHLVDAKNGYDPETMNLFTDSAQLKSGKWQYKITAVNPAGESQPSNIQMFIVK